MMRSAVLVAVLIACSCTGAKEPSPRPATATVASSSSSRPDPAPASSEGESEEPAASKPEPPSLPEVVFEEVQPAPAPAKMPTVSILSPRKGAVIPAAKALETEVKLDLKGWDLKSDGNHVQLSVDNKPYVRVDDLKRVIKLKDLASPADLGPGQHIVAAILARGNQETVKPVGKKVPAAVTSFFIEKKGDVVWKEGSPILIYSSPRSGTVSEQGLLVDFYVLNAEISKGRTVVHAAVSGPGLRAGESLSSWKPWRVRNARPGLYVIRLELYRFEANEMESGSATSVTYVSKPVPGAWSSITREFTVDAAAEVKAPR
jgi:hypothetical protein